MTDWLEALLLGVIQGITEFLPVSSDGHLAVTQQFFARLRGEKRPDAVEFFFDVMLHVGTLTAILVFYRREIIAGARGLLTDDPGLEPRFRRAEVVRVGLLAFVATLPLIPDKLIFMPYIKKAFTSPVATGVGFLITAAVLLVTTRLKGGEKGPKETTFLDALIVGIFQMFAPLPGVSRSGLTIVSALGLGFSRTWAVGFSLLIAVPAIAGAAASELLDLRKMKLPTSLIPQTIAATILAGLVGYMAILWLVRVVRSGRLWYFSVYLVVLATIVLAVHFIRGAPLDATTGQAQADPGALRRPLAGGPDRRPGPGLRPERPLARPDARGAGSPAGLAGDASAHAPGTARLDVGRTLAGGPARSG